MVSSLVVIRLCFMDLAIKFNRQFFLATVKIGYKNPCAISELYAKRLLAPEPKSQSLAAETLPENRLCHRGLLSESASFFRNLVCHAKFPVPTSPRLGGGREGALFLLFQRQSVLRPVG